MNIHTAAKIALTMGYTHIRASDGTTTPLVKVADKNTKAPRQNGWDLADSPPKLALYSRSGNCLGYYELIEEGAP